MKRIAVALLAAILPATASLASEPASIAGKKMNLGDGIKAMFDLRNTAYPGDCLGSKKGRWVYFSAARVGSPVYMYQWGGCYIKDGGKIRMHLYVRDEDRWWNFDTDASSLTKFPPFKGWDDFSYKFSKN